LARFTDVEPSTLLLPMAYLVADNVLFFGMMLVGQLRQSAGHNTTKTRGSLLIARSLAILPSDYGALCLVFLALPSTGLFLGLYACFCLGAVVLLAAALWRWGKQLKAIDREADK
jgi:hypothetical protein